MDTARGNSGRGRGRGARGGRGRGGARGRGRGRGGGNFNNQDQGHRVGDRIVLSSVDAGFAPPSPPAKSSYRSRPIQTGTEEILGNIVEHENDLPHSHPKKQFTKQKEFKEIVADTAAATLSDDDIDMSELLETSPDGLITQLRGRPTIKKLDSKPEANGYKDIWDRGQYNKVTRVIGDYPKAKDRCYIVRPIPRAQPVHYMNKFARQKLSLAEPHFRKIKPQPPMTFTSQAVYQQFRGTEACSKVAGHVLADILENPHFFRKLFSIQIPNSLKAFSIDNDSADDIMIAKQNVMKNNAENEAAAAAVTMKSQPLKMKKPRYHCLTQFSSDQPFGKLQLLKSGRVVLRVGNRIFDVCTSTQNHDTHVGAIFEHDSTEEKSRTSAPLNGNQAANNHHQDNLFLLGKIEHFFTAYYDYQKILKELDSANSG
uniref:Uncharacterized protein n=1 Tax=Panagrolaimus superbus TaxID=310955 RepID=A0A914YS64_9BILA